MWNFWLPERLLPWFLAEALPPLLLFLLLLRMLLEPEWLTMLDLALMLALTVADVSFVADAEPPVAFGVLVAVPVLLLSSRPWAAVTPVPAERSAAPNAAATALRVFMCFLAFLVESTPA